MYNLKFLQKKNKHQYKQFKNKNLYIYFYRPHVPIGGSVGRHTGRRIINNNRNKRQSEFLTSNDLSMYNNDCKNYDGNEYYSYDDRQSECSSEASTLPVDEVEDNDNPPCRNYYNVTGTLPNLVR